MSCPWHIYSISRIDQSATIRAVTLKPRGKPYECSGVVFSREGLRAEETARTSSRAACVIFARFPSRRTSGFTRSAPTPKANAPAAMNSAALEAFTPPVGIRAALGKGALRDLKYLGPPTLPQGKILISCAPFSLPRSRNRARPDEHRAAIFSRQVTDDRHGVGNRHGYFENRNAARTDGLHGGGCVFDGRRSHDGNEPNFSDPVDHVLDGHTA